MGNCLAWYGHLHHRPVNVPIRSTGLSRLTRTEDGKRNRGRPNIRKEMITLN